MTTTRERIEQAEESLAQIQNVLDHTQSALAVAEQVEAAARKGRRLAKFLLLAAVVGVAIVIVMRITRSDDDGSEPGTLRGGRGRPLRLSSSSWTCLRESLRPTSPRSSSPRPGIQAPEAHRHRLRRLHHHLATAGGRRQELELNRRLAPDVYLGTADVSEGGEVVDRMLVMRRVPEERRLERQLAAPGSDPGVRRCLDDVVRSVARLHLDASPVRGEAAHMATRDAVRVNWEDNFAVIEAHLGEVIDAEEFAEVRDLAVDYLEGRAELFEERIRAGWIRDGHGDLRAEDVFCEPDGPRILDCLAFSDELRISDVLADIGFLAMDLIHLGHRSKADVLMDLYGELTAETHPRVARPSLHRYRAHVRAKICCLRHAQGDTAKASLARSLHRMALEQLRAAAPVLVIVGGGRAAASPPWRVGLATASASRHRLGPAPEGVGRSGTGRARRCRGGRGDL
ncbi:MAG: hypothetical protein M5U19_06625 [Microthrixaceae bacterium]|nr:hypothetical protein [Microthrixaceae bacterium]